MNRPATHKVQLEQPIHFIGIGGSGMSPLAEVCAVRGLKIQGSDQSQSTTTSELQKLGIKVFSNHNPDNLAGVKTVVISSAVKDENLELIAAKKLGLKVVHRSDLLKELMEGHYIITVAGTHGKTTTTALLTHILAGLGCDPTAVVGGKMLATGSAARVGRGKIFIAEADESDGTLQKYISDIAIVNNIEADHLDYFKTEEQQLSVFRKFLNNTKEDGAIVVGWDCKQLRELVRDIDATRVAFGFTIGCDVRAIEFQSVAGLSSFQAVVEQQVVACRWPVLGRHNALNALACLSVVQALDLDVKKAAALLETFLGVERRLNRVLYLPHVQVYDDYAHNPGKISACIRALREAWPDADLRVIYQPHRYSRLETMYTESVTAFSDADQVIVVPVYAAGETSARKFLPSEIATSIREASGTEAIGVDSLAKATEEIVRNRLEKSVILTVGAGDVWQVAMQLKERLSEKKKVHLPGSPS